MENLGHSFKQKSNGMFELLLLVTNMKSNKIKCMVPKLTK